MYDDEIARAITTFEDRTRAELAAGQRETRLHGRSVAIGPRDLLMRAFTPTGGSFIIRPGYHVDDSLENDPWRVIEEHRLRIVGWLKSIEAALRTRLGL